MNSTTLEQRLEEWARWVQGGASSAHLGYSDTAAGFTEFRGDSRPGLVVSFERESEVEAAVGQLQVEGHGLRDSVRGKWIRRPVHRYAQCAEVLRAEYRAHPAYGDARHEDTGNASPKTLKRLGISLPTYYRKLALAKHFIGSRLAGHH